MKLEKGLSGWTEGQKLQGLRKEEGGKIL